MLLPPAKALDQRRHGEKLALAGEVSEACFCLCWAMLSLRAAGCDAEAAETALHLAWAQGLDGRTWQAARTLRDAIGGPGFSELGSSFRARAHLLYSWALWDMGDYAGSREQAEIARAASERSDDRGRAYLALAQVALHTGDRDLARSHFAEAVELNPSLMASTYSIKAYLHNLAGRHRAALAEAQRGLNKVGNGSLENYDITNRAAERSALMVEQATAEAFLSKAHARTALVEAQNLLDSLPFDTQLESARVKRATALVLGKAGEPQAALALLDEALRIFRRRSARPEYDLTVLALSRICSERSAKGKHVKTDT